MTQWVETFREEKKSVLSLNYWREVDIMGKNYCSGIDFTILLYLDTRKLYLYLISSKAFCIWLIEIAAKE